MQNRRGIALIGVYVVIMLLMILTGAFFVRSTVTEKAVSEGERHLLSSLYVAEAGASAAIHWLRSQVLLPPTPAGGGLIHSMPAVVLPEGTAEARIYGHKDNSTSFINRYIIFSLATVLGPSGQTVASRHIVREVQEANFAKYSYFSDDEHRLVWWRRRLIESPIWFTTGSFLEGPVHTNSHYHISGDPVFDGPVTSHDDFIDYMHGGPPADNPDFKQGIELGVEEVDVSNLHAGRLRTASAAAGLLLQGDTTVKFLSDGTMDVTNADQEWVEENMPIPANGALFVDGGDLTVSGTLNGRVTAGSSGNIVIPDNMLYAADPAVDPSSDDMLGLISETNVIVSSGAPYDISIYASIAATGIATASETDGSFTVENWWIGPPKGVLTIYGGLIQIRRGPVGTFDPSDNSKVSGYDKNYHYDSRARYSPPNWFPTTDIYETLSSVVF